MITGFTPTRLPVIKQRVTAIPYMNIVRFQNTSKHSVVNIMYIGKDVEEIQIK